MNQEDAGRVVQRKRDLEKQELLESLQGILELPMVILSFIVLVLFLIEVTLPIPPNLVRAFNLIQWFIWVAFVIEFAVKLSIAPRKAEFVKANWLMALAILLPMLRVFRVFRAAKTVRSLGTLRVITLGNRTIRQLGVLFDRRHLQYVAAVVGAVILVSGAGIYYLESGVPGARIQTFGDALWWSAGIITTVGTELYPVTPQGRVLAFVAMVFGVSIFGYIAASLASVFIQIDASDKREEEELQKRETTAERDKELAEQIRQLEERIALLAETMQGPRTRDQ